MKTEDEDPAAKQRNTQGFLHLMKSPLLNGLPFLCFYVVLLGTIYFSNHQPQSQTPQMSFGTEHDQVFLQQKNPRSNKMRQIQLEHTLQNALKHQKALEAARQAVACHHSDENRKHLIFWQNECRQDQRSYAIIAAETDDSLFEQTHLPRELPY